MLGAGLGNLGGLGGLGLSQPSSGGVSYTAEATALFARMTSEPDDTRKGIINAVIVALKSAGVWTKLDALYVLAAHTSQAALLNWVADQYNLTDPGTTNPTFTTDRGFTGDGSTDYLDTNFNPSTATTPKFQRDDHHFAVWIGTDLNSALAQDFGNTNHRICSRSSSNECRIFDSGAVDTMTLVANTAVGWLCASRDNSANFVGQKNTETANTITRTSAAVSNLPFYLLARSDTGPTASSFSTRRVQGAHFGGALNQTERTAFYNALSTYMTAVGA